MEEHNIAYFRNLWQSNVKNLENLCELWDEMCRTNIIPEEVVDEIRTTIGLAKLLMNQKLSQFNGLMDDAEFKTGEREITCIDLEGFWDMVYYEVEKIQKSFKNLDKCRENEWKFVEESPLKVLKKKIPVQKVATKVEPSKSHMLAARQRLAEAKKKMLAQCERKDQNFVEIIQPSKEKSSLDHIKNINDEKKIVDPVEATDVVVLRKSNSKKKRSPFVNKKLGAKTDESFKQSSVLYDATNQQNFHVTTMQNKENFDIVATEVNSFSKAQIRPKEKATVPASEKKSQPKDYGKLQCVTRSAKKAILAQQNTV